MDDNKFDQRIRNKVAQYRDQGVDPGALEGLHQRLAGVSYALPWYKNLKIPALVAASVALISLLNFGLYSYIYQSDNEGLLHEISQLRQDQQRLYELQNQLNNNESQRIDTVYIYEDKTVEEPGGAERLEALLAALSPEELDGLMQKYGPGQESQNAYKGLNESGLYVTGLEDAPKEVRSYLYSAGLFIYDNGKKVPVAVNNFPNRAQTRKLGKKGYYLTENNWQPFVDIGVGADNKNEVTKATGGGKNNDIFLPPRILRILEKNEMDGVGFRWGPELKLFGQNYDLGDGEPQIGAGVLVEFVLSPSLRLESGLQYAKLDYSLKESGINDLGEDELSMFPALNTDIGELNKIEVSSDVLGLPLNLKYFHPISKKKKIFASIGYTPMLYISQHYEYTFGADIDGDIVEEDFSTSLQSRKRVDRPEMYAGTFNASLGMESRLKQNLFLQAALFYQKGIDDAGVEGRELELFGLRSSLWFKVK